MYTVVRITNFDDERKAMIFPTETEAKEQLQLDWEDLYNDWIASNEIYVDEYLTYHEDDYAILSADDGDRIEWFLTEVDYCRHKAKRNDVD